jgi:hypothetical protein
VAASRSCSGGDKGDEAEMQRAANPVGMVKVQQGLDSEVLQIGAGVGDALLNF